MAIVSRVKNTYRNGTLSKLMWWYW